MITIKELMDKNNKAATHKIFYGQFVGSFEKCSVLRHFTLSYLLKNYLSIPNDNRTFPNNLEKWDCVAMSRESMLKVRESGDNLSKSTFVCVAKAAALEIVSEYYRENLNNGNFFDAINDSGIEYDIHESDLHIPVNNKTKAILEHYDFKHNVTTFNCEITDCLYFDVPFVVRAKSC